MAKTAITDTATLDKALSKYFRLEHEISVVEFDKNEEIIALQKKISNIQRALAEATQDKAEEKETLEKAILQYAEKNIDKTEKLPSGTVTVVTSKALVTKAGVTEEQAIKKLKELGFTAQYVAVKESLNKNELKKADSAVLDEAGLKIDERKNYSLKRD
jgi:type IV secretory pathway VirJ component